MAKVIGDNKFVVKGAVGTKEMIKVKVKN